MPDDQGAIQQAVLLAGGLGTRLRPLTYLQPKALLPVVNRPLISYELELVGRFGVPEVILATGYQADQLRSVLGQGNQWGIQVRYVEESVPLDTAGAIKNVESLIEGPVFVFNGDLILDVDLGLMAEAHQQSQAAVTILLRQVADITPFGLIQRGSQGYVTAFLEKASADATGHNTINAGVYIISPQILDDIPAGEPYSFETDLFPSLIARGIRIYGYLPDTPGYWNDVGRLDSYLQVNRDLLAGQLPWLSLPDIQLEQVGEDVQIQPPNCWDEGVVVESEAHIGPWVVLGENVRVGRGASLQDCVIHPGVTIGAGAHLQSVVVAGNEQVPPAHQQTQGVFCTYEP